MIRLVGKILLFVCLVSVGITIGEGFFEAKSKEVEITDIREGVKGDELSFHITEIKNYEDTQHSYPIGHDAIIKAITYQVTNQSDKDLEIDGMYPPFYLNGEDYSSINIVGMEGNRFNRYQIKEASTTVYLPMGRTTHFTLLYEVPQTETKLKGSYYEYGAKSIDYYFEVDL